MSPKFLFSARPKGRAVSEFTAKERMALVFKPLAITIPTLALMFYFKHTGNKEMQNVLCYIYLLVWTFALMVYPSPVSAISSEITVGQKMSTKNNTLMLFLSTIPIVIILMSLFILFFEKLKNSYLHRIFFKFPGWWTLFFLLLGGATVTVKLDHVAKNFSKSRWNVVSSPIVYWASDPLTSNLNFLLSDINRIFSYSESLSMAETGLRGPDHQQSLQELKKMALKSHIPELSYIAIYHYTEHYSLNPATQIYDQNTKGEPNDRLASLKAMVNFAEVFDEKPNQLMHFNPINLLSMTNLLFWTAIEIQMPLFIEAKYSLVLYSRIKSTIDAFKQDSSVNQEELSQIEHRVSGLRFFRDSAQSEYRLMLKWADYQFPCIMLLVWVTILNLVCRRMKLGLYSENERPSQTKL